MGFGFIKILRFGIRMISKIILYIKIIKTFKCSKRRKFNGDAQNADDDQVCCCKKSHKRLVQVVNLFPGLVPAKRKNIYSCSQ